MYLRATLAVLLLMSSFLSQRANAAPGWSLSLQISAESTRGEGPVNAAETVYPEVIQDFRGEAPSVPENLLPPNISPEALNIDYRDRALAKRGGVNRVSYDLAMTGGAWFRSYISANGGGWGQSDAVVTLTGTLHTYECIVLPLFPGGGNDLQIWRHKTSSTAGTALFLVNDSGTYKWEARVEHSGGTLQVTQSAGTNPVNNVPQIVTVEFDSATDTLTLTVGNGSSSNDSTGSISPNTYTQPADVLIFGGEASSDYDMSFVLCDFRVWVGTPGHSLHTSLEPLSGTPVVNYRFLPSDPWDDAGSSDIDLTTYDVLPTHGWVPDADTYDEIECIVRGSGLANERYVMVGTRGAIYSFDLAGSTRLSYPAPLGDSLSQISAGPMYRTQGLRYRDYAIFCNKSGENTIGVYGQSVWHQLSYAAPAINSGGITITAVGSGGTLADGDYKYLFAIYNSTTGVESAVGTAESTGTASAGGTDSLTLDFTTGGFMSTGRYFTGADKIRIYRTAVGGSTYYYMVDIDIDSTSYTDTGSVTLSATARDPYKGYATASRFLFEYEDRLWAGNGAGTSRLQYTERFTLADFYSENYVDVAYGDGDELTGGIALTDRALVFKKKSIWQVVVSGGEPVVDEFNVGIGCVQHATIVKGGNALYWLAEGGIYRLPLPLGSGGLENVTRQNWRDYFEGMDNQDYEACSAVWDPIGMRYILSLTVADTRYVMVFHAETGAVALWDADISGFLYNSGDYRGVYCGFKGYVAKLDDGENDGGNPYGFSHEYSGTVTSATSTTLTDSTQTFQTSFAAVSWTSSAHLGGLVNTQITIADANGENEETKTIIANTGTQITVDSAWTTTPDSTWTYRLGPIYAHWRSPLMGVDRWDRDKRIDRLRLLQVTPATADGDTLTSFIQLDGKAEETDSVSADDRLHDMPVDQGGGKEVLVGIRQDKSDETFKVSGLALGLTQKEGAP